MDQQLALMQNLQPEWRLDERTKELGLRGVQRARLALHQGTGPGPDRSGPAPPPPARRAARAA